MSAYDLNRLIQLWTADNLSTEQAVGQILLQIQALSERVNELERKMERGQKPGATPPAKR
jgi:hypothetical protein